MGPLPGTHEALAAVFNTRTKEMDYAPLKQRFLKVLMFLFTCMDVYLYGFLHMSTVSGKVRRVHWISWSWSDRWLLGAQRGFWELHLGPLLEWQVLFSPQGETSYPPSPTRKSSMQCFI